MGPIRSARRSMGRIRIFPTVAKLMGILSLKELALVSTVLSQTCLCCFEYYAIQTKL